MPFRRPVPRRANFILRIPRVSEFGIGFHACPQVAVSQCFPVDFFSLIAKIKFLTLSERRVGMSSVVKKRKAKMRKHKHRKLRRRNRHKNK